MKKVLIVTYYWPPAGGIQVYRILKFTKYLQRFGWEPIIYTAENAFYPFQDDFGKKDIPKGLTVLKKKIKEPFRIFSRLSPGKKKPTSKQAVILSEGKEKWKDKLANWVRANFFIPDARSLWINPSVRYLSDYIKSNKVDLIFTTAPPHSVTLIGMKLKMKTGIPWVSDWRDPWTQVDYFEKFLFTSRSRQKHHRLEQLVFKYADVITTVSHSWKEDLLRIGAQDVEVIYSGFDPVDFKNIDSHRDDKFRIVHAGTLSNDRIPVGFIRTLSEMLTKKKLSSKLELVFIGEVDFRLINLINDSNLKDFTLFKSFMSKDKVLKELSKADLTLVILNQSKNMAGRIPGKIYECLGMRKATLCLGDEGSDIDHILQSTGIGRCIADDNTQILEEYIYSVYTQKLNFKVNGAVLKEYESEFQSRKLAEIFSKTISGE